MALALALALAVDLDPPAASADAPEFPELKEFSLLKRPWMGEEGPSCPTRVLPATEEGLGSGGGGGEQDWVFLFN